MTTDATFADSLLAALRRRYMDRMMASQRGRSFFLAQASRAEDTDEGRFFVELERRVDDPELAKLIRIHRDDEARHARLFREAQGRLGVPLESVPEHLDLVPRLDRALGGFFERMVDDRLSVMEAYLLLQVIEERATTQFSVLEPIARRHDPALADLLAAVTRDEERHLKYCRAIAKRYAPDDATLERTLVHYREVEARVFVEQSRDNMAHTLAQGLLAVGPVEEAAWRGLLGVMRRQRVRPDRTPFATAAAAA
jgi:rubrerythrin